MARWTQLYDELAGPRYPALIAYARLLTEDQDAADALVASALRRTFARPKKLTGAREAEHLVRSAIVNGFVTSAGDEAHTKRGRDTQATETEAGAVEESTTAEQPAPEPDINPYAPPGDQARALPALAAHLTTNPRDPKAPEPEPDRASAEIKGRSGDDQLREALRSLSPRARAVAVLRHHDALTPGQISAQLDMEIGTVRALLREVREAVWQQLGLDVSDDGADADDHAGVEIAVADHAGRR